MCVSALARSVGWVGVGWDREVGGWVVGVSVLPRAQEWCGRDLGSSGTWLALEFYCVPARAWHSHASEYGRTEGKEGKGARKDGRKEGREEEEEESKAAKGRSE